MASSSNKSKKFSVPRQQSKTLNQAVSALKQSLNNAYGRKSMFEPSLWDTTESGSIKLIPTRSLISQMKKVFKSKDQYLSNFDSLFRIFDFKEEELFEMFKTINPKNPHATLFRNSFYGKIKDQKYLDEFIEICLNIENETLSSIEEPMVEEGSTLKFFTINYSNLSSFVEDTIIYFEPNYKDYNKFLPIYEKLIERVSDFINNNIEARINQIYKPEDLSEKDKMFLNSRKKNAIRNMLLNVTDRFLQGELLDQIPPEFIEKYHNRIHLNTLYELYKQNGMNPLMNQVLTNFLKHHMEKRIRATIGPAADFMNIQINWDDEVVRLFESVQDSEGDECVKENYDDDEEDFF